MFNIKIIGTHNNCLDGNCCMAIESNIENTLNVRYLLNPNEKFSNYTYFYWIIYISSFIFNIKLIFTDIIPYDIIFILNFFKNTRIKIEIIDHHCTQQNTINEIEKLDFKNLTIDFKPDSKFGATKQLVDKYKDKLTPLQISTFMKFAACDMWNKNYFPDFIFLIFGLNLFKYEININDFDPEILWEISFDGESYINMFIEKGHTFYKNTEKLINNLIQNCKIINYKHYNILLINTSELPLPYCKINMVSAICYYFVNNKNDNINTLAIYNNSNKYVSLRSTNDSSDVSEIAKLCSGGGHKSASGCDYEKFINLIKT
jgi:oligoribonuclease NrnB/cAMP/cGMP phosphodiesterase (DHH superfamily)